MTVEGTSAMASPVSDSTVWVDFEERALVGLAQKSKDTIKRSNRRNFKCLLCGASDPIYNIDVVHKHVRECVKKFPDKEKQYISLRTQKPQLKQASIKTFMVM
jgi:hypothetical protein